MKKRLAALVAAVAISATALVGCGGASASGAGESAEHVVGLVTDEGGLNDKSFNQISNDGLTMAKNELGVQYTALESQKKEDFAPNIQALVDNGSTLTFAAGYQLADAVPSVAATNPDVHFCIIDSVVDAENVMSITFKEEEGSFLMGVLAGLTTKTNKVGFIGGKDSETIIKFEAGFAAGVKAVNPVAAEGLISSNGTATGATVKYADSYNDTNKGYELAKSLYESGCDVIYHAAAGVGIGMFQAAQELSTADKKCWGIGVDMDQAVSLPDYANVILSSMVKRVDNATYDTVQDYINGTISYEAKVLGIAEGGVGMADSTSVNTSQEAIDKANEFAEKIKAGEIVVPATRAEVIAF